MSAHGVARRMEFLDPTQAADRESEMHDLGPAEQIPAGQGRCFVVRGQRLAVFRIRDGRLFAIDDVCPHRGGPLSSGVIGIDQASGTEAVVCPLHAYKFSLRDGRGLDTEMHVRARQAEVRGGRIFVSLH